jgi:hypothetical protein
MSKNKEFKENNEIINNLNVESKLDPVNIIEELDLSSTLKINNTGEEVKITIDNITNIGESKKEILPEVVKELNKSEPVIEEIKINIINHEKPVNKIKDLKDEFFKSEPVKKLENIVEDLKKDFENISIVDVSKKKLDKFNHSENPIKSSFEKVISMSPVSVNDIEEKAFDSLIMIGGGFIAATNLASKTFALFGSKFINKK